MKATSVPHNFLSTHLQDSPKLKEEDKNPRDTATNYVSSKENATFEQTFGPAELLENNQLK
jgi:hypothetical protein